MIGKYTIIKVFNIKHFIVAEFIFQIVPQE